METKKIIKQNDGVIGVAIIGVLAFIFTLALIIFTSSLSEVTNSRKSSERGRALEAAEAGIDRVLYHLKTLVNVTANPLPNVTLSTPIGCIDPPDASITRAQYKVCWELLQSVNNGPTSFPTIIIRVVSQGYVPSKTSSAITRRLEAQYTMDASGGLGQFITFNTTGWFDLGGLELDNATITGDVFSNGPIRLTHNGSRLVSSTVKVADTATSFLPWNSLTSYHINGTSPQRPTVGVNPGTTVIQGRRVRNINAIGTSATVNCLSQSLLQKNGVASGCDAPVVVPAETNPVTAANIAALKTIAASGTARASDPGCTVPTMNTSKISANWTLPNNCNIQLTGTVWVTGNLRVNNNSVLALDCTTFGNNGDAAIIVDGKINFVNGSTVSGTDSDPIFIGVNACAGSINSYMLVVSNYVNTAKTYPGNSNASIDVSNNSAQSIMVSPNGWTHLNNNASLRIAASYGVSIDNNAVGITGDTPPIVINPGTGGLTTLSFDEVFYNLCKPGPTGDIDTACPLNLIWETAPYASY